MPVAKSRARKLALSFETVSEAPLFDRMAFRTPRKIFATLASDGGDLNLMLDASLQEFHCEQAPTAFAPVPGGWGRMDGPLHKRKTPGRAAHDVMTIL